MLLFLTYLQRLLQLATPLETTSPHRHAASVPPWSDESESWGAKQAGLCLLTAV